MQSFSKTMKQLYTVDINRNEIDVWITMKLSAMAKEDCPIAREYLEELDKMKSGSFEDYKNTYCFESYAYGALNHIYSHPSTWKTEKAKITKMVAALSGKSLEEIRALGTSLTLEGLAHHSKHFSIDKYLAQISVKAMTDYYYELAIDEQWFEKLLSEKTIDHDRLSVYCSNVAQDIAITHDLTSTDIRSDEIKSLFQEKLTDDILCYVERARSRASKARYSSTMGVHPS
jgi:hypothetical protein